MRIVHLSDIHVWRLTWNPLRLLNKRPVGMFDLLSGRARKFRLERLEEVVDRVRQLAPDHVLITGDLTTTALPSEFLAARKALNPLLTDPDRATVIPGNHDRYTTGAVRYKKFEGAFGAFAPDGPYPWLRAIDRDTSILGLDPTRSHLSARGYLPPQQLERAKALVADEKTRPKRLIVACHYPVDAPEAYVRELAKKRMVNAASVRPWLATLGPHLYCCGHVHAAWAFHPVGIPEELCLNSGAPLLRDPTGQHLPGFLEIDLNGPDVRVIHHAWSGPEWITVPMVDSPNFFRALTPSSK
ncbi:MAG: putative phosphohydrolase [Planctomycetota bacterium]|nr:putative phosphohydrolase [Planctomycetota bacterium]